MAATRKYPVELKERAISMVRELEQEQGNGSTRGVIGRVAEHLGVHPEALRSWVRAEEQGKRPSGQRVPGSPSEKDVRIGELERENRELKRANSILKAASTFFAQELNPRPPQW